MNSAEYGLKNYLNKHGIYKDNDDMQTIIINSFFCQCGGDNDEDWNIKLKFCKANFGRFAMYAHNNWKHQKTNQ